MLLKMNKKYLNKIVLGDCLKLFENIPDNSVDITFADPPFNLGKKYNSYKDSLKLQEYLNWCEKWICEMVRITKPEGSVFIHNIPKWLNFYASYLNQFAYFRHWISWDAPTAPMGKSLQPSHYGILYYTKSSNDYKFYEIRHPHKRDRRTGYLLKDYGGKKESLHPYGPLTSDVWTDIHRIRHNKFRDEHPCQLPVHLLERIILMSTDENDIILDPFMGTGTTAIAAKQLGRKFIGFDVDPVYVKLSKNKIKNTKSGSKISNLWVSIYLNEAVTIRDVDWDNLKEYYILPTSMKEIDYTKIKLRDNSIIKKIVTPQNNQFTNTLFDNIKPVEKAV